ncbi:DUF6807 domain-containing protein [Lignipirellula cremea]|uniref:Methane oxygenase PmoA n=1 Tax=Lignipirellula cremea TaxID=2528010 RepID=A0A518E3C9_9BACT|nr:PmoA family protein [Lignipirellula cremea]QDU98553.1 hypothetical protein Pla8534_64220 [Lignipirellula cremea]
MTATIPRCQVVPLPDHQVSLQVDGKERTRWHARPSDPRPFFYPFLGPGGSSLTRMGHPGAPNHDHHRSIWFAHHRVVGIDFWSDQTEARIRQQRWLACADSDAEAILAVELDWTDGHDPAPLLRQELVAALRPGENGETLLEVQATFRPRSEQLEFGQTNFGFFAVRVAKTLSEHFGGGRLTSSTGAVGEPAIFGKPAAWMDYSGPASQGVGPQRTEQTEGITCFDHPANPGNPTGWHVRADGWMGASPCMHQPLTTTIAAPLQLRYLLHAHAGPLDPDKARSIAAQFTASPGFQVTKATVKHEQYTITRRC